MQPRLGVNVDHVATLRQARGEKYPSPVEASQICLDHGADQITIHLREDRRHILDTDIEAVHLVTKRYGRPLNFEMGCSREIIDIAVVTRPEWVCLVPEKREEKTTEGGLDLQRVEIFEKVERACHHFKNKIPDTKISLFLESRPEMLEMAGKLPVDAIEIHTGDYARAFLMGEDFSAYIKNFQAAKSFLKDMNKACHAGHGLTLSSSVPLLEHQLFEEYNIGHWIISQAIFDGLGNVVKKFSDLFQKNHI